MKMANQAISADINPQSVESERRLKLSKKARELLESIKEPPTESQRKTLVSLIKKIDSEFRQYPYHQSARLLSLQGCLLDAAGYHRAAIQKHSTATMLEPNEWIFHYRLIESLHADEQYKECIRLCHTFPSDNPYWRPQIALFLQNLPAEYRDNSSEHQQEPAELKPLPEDKQNVNDVNADEIEFQLVESDDIPAPQLEAVRPTSLTQDSTWFFTRMFRSLLPSSRTQPQAVAEEKSAPALTQ